MASIAAHELAHSLGLAGSPMPNLCPEGLGHVCDDPRDVLAGHPSVTNLSQSILDVGNDDYYAHSGAWADVQDSPYLEHLDVPRYVLRLNTTGAGFVTSDPVGLFCAGACSVAVPSGTRVFLNALTDSGIKTRWSGDCEGNLFRCDLTVDADALVAVRFAAQKPKVFERAVVIAVDVSQSMQAMDVEPTRIDALQYAMARYPDSVQKSVALGLVKFAASAELAVDLTRNREKFRASARSITLLQQTATGEAIFGALDALEGRAKQKAIVLVSDGALNAGRPTSEAIAAAKKAGVPVHTIALGTDGGTVVVQDEVVPVPSAPDEMRNIARKTGGTFAVAQSERELTSALRAITERLGYAR
jgi:Ca-activated chloride channel family protein